ncbi:ALDH-like protein [Phlegmacium glaucopus]|nr:ALDH-like protein [Phlegmacium glaucopus]
MPRPYTHKFDTPTYKGAVTINTGMFIGGQWRRERLSPALQWEAKKDVDLAVEAAKKGLRRPGAVRGMLLHKFANLIEEHIDEFAALEVLAVGKIWANVKHSEITAVVACLRSYAGWADKVQGKTIETNENKLAYTRREPYGVVVMVAFKIGPALATAIVLKPSKITPLSTLKIVDLINEAGFPPGVVNIVNGYVLLMSCVFFFWAPPLDRLYAGIRLLRRLRPPESTLTGRKILKALSESNLKVVTLELGEKSPSVIFDDADLDQATKRAASRILRFYIIPSDYKGQSCAAGSRIFVQQGIYDQFLTKFTAIVADLTSKTGDPSGQGTERGPQVSKIQFDQQAPPLVNPLGDEGYFIKPTIFTDVHSDMKIVKEETFGPVAVVIKFKDEAEVVEMANNKTYGSAAHIFTENLFLSEPII